MSYEFAEGFDTYGNGFNLVSGNLWDLVQGTMTTNNDVRFAAAGSCPTFSITVSGSQNVCRKNLSGSRTTLICGFAFKLANLPSGNPVDIIDFWDNANCQCCLAVTSAGALQFYRANGAILGGGLVPLSAAIGSPSAGGLIVGGVWTGIAISVTFNTSSGAVSAFLNGSQNVVIGSVALNTCGDGVNSANQVSLGMCTNPVSGGIKYDDFYCLNNLGGSLNAPIGSDARIVTKMPSAPGFYTNWTPNGLGANWQNAAVQPANVADFNSNNTPGTKDSYTMQSAGTLAAPLFLLVRSSLTRDDAGPHTPSLFVRSGSTDSAGVVTNALSAGYLYYDAVFANDPNTGLPWGGGGADAAQVGIIEG